MLTIIKWPWTNNCSKVALISKNIIGLSMSTAINIFLKKVARERRIPFELSADPFYSESNIHYLENKMDDYKAGLLNVAEHELIEE